MLRRLGRAAFALFAQQCSRAAPVPALAFDVGLYDLMGLYPSCARADPPGLRGPCLAGQGASPHRATRPATPVGSTPTSASSTPTPDRPLSPWVRTLVTALASIIGVPLLRLRAHLPSHTAFHLTWCRPLAQDRFTGGRRRHVTSARDRSHASPARRTPRSSGVSSPSLFAFANLVHSRSVRASIIATSEPAAAAQGSSGVFKLRLFILAAAWQPCGGLSPSTQVPRPAGLTIVLRLQFVVMFAVGDSATSTERSSAPSPSSILSTSAASLGNARYSARLVPCRPSADDSPSAPSLLGSRHAVLPPRPLPRCSIRYAVGGSTEAPLGVAE